MPSTKNTSKVAGGASKRRKKLPLMIPGSIEVGPLPMMVNGRYFVGDLCSILSENAWKELDVLSHVKENKYGTEGHFILSNGRVLVIFHLPNGDGVYPDQKDRKYYVSSGTIGITLVEGLEVEYGDIDNKKEDWDSKLEMSGNIIDYKKGFVCMSTSIVNSSVGPISTMAFGENVVVNSDDELSGIGAFLHMGLAAAKETAAKEAATKEAAAKEAATKEAAKEAASPQV
jgi:hypothetical protein